MHWLVSKFLAEKYRKKFLTFYSFNNDFLAYALFTWVIDNLKFKYRRKITVTEQSGNDLTDYQVLIELDSTNFDFSHAKSDGSDIRFYDGNRFLDYWIEDWDSENQRAKIWVKVPNIPANSSASFYMYYGNSDLISKSNKEKVFDSYSNFSCDICDNYDLKFGVFTDLHWTDADDTDTAMGHRCFSERESKFNEIINAFNSEPDLDFVIELGDFINGFGNSLTPEQQLQQAESYYSQIQVPRHYVYGNHDVNSDGVTKDYFKQNTAKEADYEYYDYGNYRIIILDACYGGGNYIQGEIPSEEIDWLRNEALNTDKKCIIFTHQPLSEYKGRAEEIRISNRAEVRTVLENAGNVIAVIQGHVHGSFVEIINGIPYFTLEAVVDECGEDYRAYAIVYAKGDKVFIRGFKNMASMGNKYHTVLAGSGEKSKNKYFDIDVVNKKLIQHSNVLASTSNEAFGVAYMANVNISNFEVRVKMKEVDDDIIGILFCYQDSSHFYHYSYSNHFTGRTSTGEGTSEGPKRWIGKDTTTITENNLVSDNNAPGVSDIVEIIIRHYKNNIKVYQNGEEVFNVTNSTYTSGDIGLMTNACEGAEFYPPFIIRKYVEPEPSVSIGEEAP